MAFYVGQRVVCIDDEGAPTITRGRVYTIANVRINDGLVDVLGRPCPSAVWLVEATGVTGTEGFNSIRFRPLDEKRIDIFRAHLAPRSSLLSHCIPTSAAINVPRKSVLGATAMARGVGQAAATAVREEVQLCFRDALHVPLNTWGAIGDVRIPFGVLRNA